jgi:hypothetical protein
LPNAVESKVKNHLKLFVIDQLKTWGEQKNKTWRIAEVKQSNQKKNLISKAVKRE